MQPRPTPLSSETSLSPLSSLSPPTATAPSARRRRSPRPTRAAPLAALATLAAALLAGAPGEALAQVQTWNYKSYLRDPATGQYSKERFRTSTVRLQEKDGRATFRMITAGRGDPCISASDLPAEVERTAELLIMTVRPPLTGCEPFRYHIKLDGSGGIRLFLRGENWVPDGFDHDLTPQK